MTEMALIAGWCFAVSLFLPLFAWTLMPLLPRCAATRHLVWLALFSVLAVLPLLAFAVPPQILLPQAAQATPSMPVAPPAAAVASHGWDLADAILFVVLAWLLGIGFHLARMALGLFGLHRLRRNSLPFEGANNVRMADEGPLAFGVFRPLILLPHDAALWPPARLRAVLAHERAHLNRRDSLSQMLAQLVCAFYWPNLLLWLASRSMRREAEIAADNAVLAAGMRPSDYAAELLQLAGQTLRLPALAMAAPSLEARVKSVLSPTHSRGGVRARDVFKIVWLGMAAAVALAFGRPAIGEVRAEPPTPPAPAAAPAPAAEAAPPAPEAAPAPRARHTPMHHHHRVTVTVDTTGEGGRLTDADKARIDAAVAQVRATMAGLRPKIEQAIREAHADQAAAQSVQKAMPQIHAAIAQAMAQIRPVIRQAVNDARVEAQVTAALDRAQIRIDADLARAERDVARASAKREHDHSDMPSDPPDPPDPNP